MWLNNSYELPASHTRYQILSGQEMLYLQQAVRIFHFDATFQG